MIKKSVISLIAYDACMLPDSIRAYYPFVDEIILGLDENRISWSNNKFSFDENGLWQQLKSIDVDNKIKVIEDNFHKSPVPIENDNYERNLLKSHCTHPWIFSVDADETMINPKDFFYRWLPLVEPYYTKMDIAFTWFLPMKEFESDYLVIARNDNRWFRGDTQSFATDRNNVFKYCRYTNQQRIILSPLVMMHWSFCRADQALEMKLNNFGHSNNTKSDPFFNNWRICNLDNYTQLTNFKTSGMGQHQWEKLIKVPKGPFWDIARMEANHVY